VSVHVSVCRCLCVYIPVSLSVCLSVCLYICRSVCIPVFICLSIYLSVCLSVRLLTCLYLLVYTFVCLYTSLSVCRSVCLSVLQDYSLSQTTLDDVFIHFANEQSEEVGLAVTTATVRQEVELSESVPEAPAAVSMATLPDLVPDSLEASTPL